MDEAQQKKVIFTASSLLVLSYIFLLLLLKSGFGLFAVPTSIFGILNSFFVPGFALALFLPFHRNNGPMWMLLGFIIQPFLYYVLSLPLKIIGYPTNALFMIIFSTTGLLLAFLLSKCRLNNKKPLNWPHNPVSRIIYGLIAGLFPIITILMLERPIISSEYKLWLPDTWNMLNRMDLENVQEMPIFERGWEKIGQRTFKMSENSAYIDFESKESQNTNIRLILRNNSESPAKMGLYQGNKDLGKLIIPSKWDPTFMPQGAITDGIFAEIKVKLISGKNQIRLHNESKNDGIILENLTNLDWEGLKEYFSAKDTVNHWEDAREALLFALSLTEKFAIWLPSHNEFINDGGGYAPSEPPLHAIYGAMALSYCDSSNYNQGFIGRLGVLDLMYLLELFALFFILGFTITSKNPLIVISIGTIGSIISLLNGYHNFSLFPDTSMCIILLGFIYSVVVDNQRMVFLCSLALCLNQIAALALITAMIMPIYFIYGLKQFRKNSLYAFGGMGTAIIIIVVLMIITGSANPSSTRFLKDYDERYTALFQAILNPNFENINSVAKRLGYFTALCALSCPMIILCFPSIFHIFPDFFPDFKIKNPIFLFSSMGLIFYLVIIGISDHFRIHYILPHTILGTFSFGQGIFGKKTAIFAIITCFISLYFCFSIWHDFENRDFWNGLPVKTQFVRQAFGGFKELERQVFTLK